MVEITRRTEETRGVAAGDIPFDDILFDQRPMVFRGLARDWPLVQAGLRSAEEAMAYLARFDAGRPVVVYTGPPEIEGRFGYDETCTRMNFQAGRAPLAEVLERLRAGLGEPQAEAVYVGSTDLDAYLPGFTAENGLGLAAATFGPQPPLASIWLGGRTTARAHYDMSNNIAVCAVGRRRFTLFPPDQAANLYPGPLEPTPGGQVVSLVDFERPDFARHPRFRQALAAAQVAELEPGDVLVYPALWWHQVEALAPFNVLVNYWWNAAPAWLDTPQNTLLHALLSLRDRPEYEKRAWRELFDYYVFGPPDQAGAHLPEPARGPLGAMDEMQARRLRAQLLNRLNR